MNIIYLLTNLDNGKKYIGQKSECRIEKVNGLNTIINNKSELPYFGSSSSEEMKEDLKNCKFEASILEIVNDKKFLLEREDYYARLYDVVNSDDFYNKIYPSDFNKYKNSKVIKRDFQNSIKNEFGQTYKEYASHESNISKRINSAKKVGFDKLEDFYLDIYKKIKKQKIKNLASIAREYGVERHTISRLVKEVNLDKFYFEINNKTVKKKKEIENLRIRGASIKKIGQILNLEFATILSYIGTKKIRSKDFLVSKRKGLSEDELGYKIMDLFLKNYTFEKINKELKLTKDQTLRYFHRFIRKHLEISDFKGILKE